MRESWAVQTECAECGKDRHLTGGLCRDCSESLGYTTPSEDACGVHVDGQFFTTVATREGAEVIRDHWAGPNQVVEIVEVKS